MFVIVLVPVEYLLGITRCSKIDNQIDVRQILAT